MTYYYFVTYKYEGEKGSGSGTGEVPFHKKIMSIKDVIAIQEKIKEAIPHEITNVCITDFQLLRRSRYQRR